MEKAAKVIEAEYLTSINIHAPMEPMNALALEKDGIWHIYTGNQFNTRTTGIAAAVAGTDPKNVVIHQHFLGGGFGRRLESDMVVPAVAAAKAVGKPVKLIYAREDDMQMDFTRPLTYQKVKVGPRRRWQGHRHGARRDRRLADREMGHPGLLCPGRGQERQPRTASPVNGADYWYTIPNHTVRNFENKLAQAATPSGQLRSVAPALDLLGGRKHHGRDRPCHRSGPGGDAAETARRRRRQCRRRQAVERGRRQASRQRAARRGRPLRLRRDEARSERRLWASPASARRSAPVPTWTACVAHVKVDPETGEVTLKKVTVAMDVGTVVNPDGVRAQIEGSVLWGASLALLEKATMENGGIQQTNFDSYTPMRMSQMPELDISIIGNGEPAVGCGEPAVTVIAPAIGNAIFNAVGARVRSLPITAEAVKAAMKT